MTKNSITKFFVLTTSILGFAASAFAGKEVVDSKGKNVVEKAKESWITGDIGINVVSQYVSRGLIFENQGGIIQPYADLYFQIYKGDGFLSKASINLGIWESFHSRHTDAGLVGGGSPSARNWYESDFTAGLALTFAKHFTFTPSYYAFVSPNSGFPTFQGLNASLAIDDGDWLGAFALHPHVTVLWELENKAGSGDDEGVYYEVGVAPAVPVGPITITLPVTAGFGSHDFYNNNAGFGYVSAGVTAAYALKFMPEQLGTWTVTGGATYYYLGGNSLREFNTPTTTQNVAGNTRDAGNSEWVFSGGLSVAF